ncbi:MAG: hypothetical protein ACKO39_06500, partial [Chthoniobacterales bacterium]
AVALGEFERGDHNASFPGEATRGEREDVLFPQPAVCPTGAGALARAKQHIDTAAKVARNTTQSVAKNIEESLPVAKNSTTKTASVIAALTTIFIVPGVLVTIVAFGLFRLRKRQR